MVRMAQWTTARQSTDHILLYSVWPKVGEIWRQLKTLHAVCFATELNLHIETDVIKT